jgi:hypothetical protein
MADPNNVYHIGADAGIVIKFASTETAEDVQKGVEALMRFLKEAVPSVIMREALPQILDEIIISYYDNFGYWNRG